MIENCFNLESMKIEVDDSLILKNRPRSVSVNSKANAIRHGLSFNQIYTWFSKGWHGPDCDEMLYICELKRWVPSDVFDPVEMINPN